MFVRRTDFLHNSMRFALLFLYVLSVFTRPIKCQSVCSRESLIEVKKIKQKLRVMETNDCKLYTPTLEDYENCSRSILICFSLEVKVLNDEIQTPRHSVGLINKTLNNLTNKFKDKRETCPVCELYREESAETFLEALENVLQKINSANCK